MMTEEVQGNYSFQYSHDINIIMLQIQPIRQNFYFRVESLHIPENRFQ
jgi:hypothetical protein